MNLKLAYSKYEKDITALTGDPQQLWEQFRLGNQQALALIYQQHFFKLYNYGMKISRDADLVKDCIQDLFIHIWKQRESISDTTSIKYYLFKALRRRIVDELTSSKEILIHPQAQKGFVFELPYEQTLIEEQISQEKKQKLLACLNTLPKRQKEALFLRYYENMSPQEVASIMSLSIDSTYVLFSKALHYLRKNLQKFISYGLPVFFLLK